jgi:hypothetical protein
MANVTKSSVRLYVIIARDAPKAVVFRRGPSKQVLLTIWHTDSDIFDEGQWLKGRIYERRCDLSPSGNFLIYFAANYKEPYFSWTAISKPPFLTALALWQKGDGWGGGGLFKNESEILLNHRADEMTLVEGFKLPKKIKIKPFGERPGWGEDSPILDTRLTRDGWNLLQSGQLIEHKSGAPIWIEFNPPIIWSRLNSAIHSLELREAINGLRERNGAWYITEHFVFDKNSNETISLGKTDWADWDRNGELLFAKDGRIFRLGLDENGKLNAVGDAKMLIDLSERKFEPKETPSQFRSW